MVAALLPLQMHDYLRRTLTAPLPALHSNFAPRPVARKSKAALAKAVRELYRGLNLLKNFR